MPGALSKLKNDAYSSSLLEKVFRNGVLSQAYSPCGRFLAVGDNRGVLSIFRAQDLLNQKTPDLWNFFLVSVYLQVTQVVTADKFLLIAHGSRIEAYLWHDVVNNPFNRPRFFITVPQQYGKVDADCMAYNRHTDLLYVGTSDRQVVVIDVETNHRVISFGTLHGQINDLANLRFNVMTASEDGRVHHFDMRSGERVSHLRPYKFDNVQRSQYGRWISAIDLHDHFMVCGGGPYLSLWDIRKRNVCKVFDSIQDKGIHVAQFYGDKVIGGGLADCFCILTENSVTKFTTSSNRIYCAASTMFPYKLLTYGGNSSHIDICIDSCPKGAAAFVPYEPTEIPEFGIW